MNKMLKSEVLDFSTKTKYSISYFDDDTIDTVRHHIANVMDSHPDRLFILVNLKLPNDYYQKDPRRWDDLFARLSYNGQPINQITFQEYQVNYRTPQTEVTYSSFDAADWASKPQILEDFYAPTREFTEYRIFGVEEDKSYILPLKFNSVLTSRIPTARLPLPQVNTLVSSLYNSESILNFLVIPYDETAENAKTVYFPYLRNVTPNRLSEETINLLLKNRKTLQDLLEFEVFEPKSTAITRVKFYAKWVTTNFGSAVRTRFEQIFYGGTVSEDVPYVGFFTSNNEISRHKFYKPNPDVDQPYVDMTAWNRWRARKPIRNKPTLLFYKGESRDDFDRIAVTDEDITITLYRTESNSEKIESMKKKAISWVKTFDALMPFIEKDDIDSDRFKVDDLEIVFKYDRPLDDIDLRRFNCVSSIFNRPEKDKAKFGLLRSDRQNYGISPLEVKLIQSMKEGPIKANIIATELNITLEAARKAITDLEYKLEEDPNLIERAFREYPTLELRTDAIKASSVTEVDRIEKYANLLRYIVQFPDDKDLDNFCPKRMETVAIDTGIAPVDTFEVAPEAEEEYADLFSYLEEEQPVEKKKEIIVEEKVEQKRAPKIRKQTKYGYYLDRLAQFDPDTYNPAQKDFKYAKLCEQSRQPTILSEDDLDRLDDTPYEPELNFTEDEIELTYDPNGMILCPEYWCMRDNTPLTKSQLKLKDGEYVCPVCGKKLRTSDKDDPTQYTVIKRSDFLYPGYKKDKFANGKNMPCCFKKPQKKEKEDTEDNKYFIVRENIAQLKDLRTAFLPKQLLQTLQIDEKYEILDKTKRFANGMSGFFRVGLGRPSETLPELLGLKAKIASPRESIQTILKCSFLRTWTTFGESNLESIENSLNQIPPYSEDDIVRTNLSKIISGIDEAFEKKRLTILQELEYSAIFLQCDIFRIYTNSNTVGCMFYSPIVKARSRGIIILQNGQYIDILSHVTRFAKGFVYKSNIFDNPFNQTTYVALENARSQSCQTKIPSYEDAVKIITEIVTEAQSEEYQIILDPFGRAQAFYVPKQMILPFQSVPLPNVESIKRLGYDKIDKEYIPTYENVKKYLKIAERYSDGYLWIEDLFNTEGDRVEILLRSGLRIPVYPEKIQTTQPTEVIQTVNEIGEDQLVFGSPSEELQQSYNQISYASEVYEFLLFELTNDLETSYPELKSSLEKVSPNRKQVEPELREWFTKNVKFTGIDKPINFISKIRTPCGQFKKKECTGNLCGWNGKTCGIQVRESVKKEALFNRLLSALVENPKIRSMVLDGRTSPFFSTILYLQLPNELIYTDLNLPL